MTSFKPGQCVRSIRPGPLMGRVGTVERMSDDGVTVLVHCNGHSEWWFVDLTEINKVERLSLTGTGTVEPYSELTVEARPCLPFYFEQLVCVPPANCIVTAVAWGNENSNCLRVEANQRVAVTFRNMGPEPCNVAFTVLGFEAP